MLRVGLTADAGDYEIAVKQQSIGRRDGIGNRAEERRPVAFDQLAVVKRLFDGGGLEAAGTVGIHGEIENQRERPFEGLQGSSPRTAAVGGRKRTDAGVLGNILQEDQRGNIEILAVGELDVLLHRGFHVAMRGLNKSFYAETAVRGDYHVAGDVAAGIGSQVLSHVGHGCCRQSVPGDRPCDLGRTVIEKGEQRGCSRKAVIGVEDLNAYLVRLAIAQHAGEG